MLCATFAAEAGLGRLVMMMGTSRATCSTLPGNYNVGQGKLGPLCGISIEADHAPSALNEIAGDRAAHDAKPDNSNGLVHESCFHSCRIRLTGSGRSALTADQRQTISK